MPSLLPPARMRQCPASSRSFLRGPDGPCGGSTWTGPALRRSYRARENAGQNKIRITKVSMVSGEPRRSAHVLRTGGALVAMAASPWAGGQERQQHLVAWPGGRHPGDLARLLGVSAEVSRPRGAAAAVGRVLRLVPRHLRDRDRVRAPEPPARLAPPRRRRPAIMPLARTISRGHLRRAELFLWETTGRDRMSVRPAGRLLGGEHR
jgi:hypothetical protein